MSPTCSSVLFQTFSSQSRVHGVAQLGSWGDNSRLAAIVTFLRTGGAPSLREGITSIRQRCSQRVWLVLFSEFQIPSIISYSTFPNVFIMTARQRFFPLSNVYSLPSILYSYGMTPASFSTVSVSSGSAAGRSRTYVSGSPSLSWTYLRSVKMFACGQWVCREGKGKMISTPGSSAEVWVYRLGWQWMGG